MFFILKRSRALRRAWYLGALLQHSGVSIHACTPIRPLLAIGFCVYTALAFRNNISRHAATKSSRKSFQLEKVPFQAGLYSGLFQVLDVKIRAEISGKRKPQIYPFRGAKLSLGGVQIGP